MRFVPGVNGHNPIIRGYADRKGGRILIHWDRTVTMVSRNCAHVSLACSRAGAASILRILRKEFRRLDYYNTVLTPPTESV